MLFYFTDLYKEQNIRQGRVKDPSKNSLTPSHQFPTIKMKRNSRKKSLAAKEPLPAVIQALNGCNTEKKLSINYIIN